MKKDLLSLFAILAVVIAPFVVVFCYCDYVSSYQETTRAYVYSAYKNGAINERECASLMDLASDFHVYPEVRMRKAKYVRKMVDRAYEEQK